ncbi:MAG TPA: PHP domain-containing protein [Spirochaetota bacterium]|nr:PHP domain-containing protein [Spirochaetota bacterium]HPU90172.1 PHP domain-containing protein [Spirochaetota bacterium]
MTTTARAEGIVDLHAHTTASDGIYAPARLVDLAIESGLRAIAITDHDTIDGLDEGLARAAERGFLCVPGVELSVEYEGGTFHLVGLSVDRRNRALCDTLEELKLIRSKRVDGIINDLNRHGIAITAEELHGVSGDTAIGRPHIARALIRKGYGTSMTEIFSKYLVRGKPGYVKKRKIAPSEAVRLITDAGGIPVIAHPISLNFKLFARFEEILDGLVAIGVRGVEAYASMHTPEEAERFAEIARSRGLLVTGGSDFHGDKNERLGFYADGSPIPAEILADVENFGCAEPRGLVS